MSLTYLCTLPLPDAWFDRLRERAPDVEVHRIIVHGAEAREPIDPALLSRVDLLHTSSWLPEAKDVPNLRCVQLDTSGADHVRASSLWASDVPISTLGGIAPVPMAEYALMATLELAHRMPRLLEHRTNRAWPSDAERLAALTPIRLPGATMGIVGYGRIGREIARLARAFGMDVIGVSRTGLRRSDAVQFDTGRLDVASDSTEMLPTDRLHEALRRSDVLVVVAPLTDLTRGMIDAAALDELPHGALVVNIARGGIVDEAALLERLRDGRIGGVALDVFDDEPLAPASLWWSEPRALVTPHVAGLAPSYLDHTLDLVVENLSRLAQGQPVLNKVDRVSGY